MRSADVSVLVIAEKRVYLRRVGSLELDEFAHELGALIAVVLTKEFGPFVLVDMWSVHHIAGEQQMSLSIRLVHQLVEASNNGLVVTHAALQIGAYEETPAVGQTEDAPHELPSLPHQAQVAVLSRSSEIEWHRVSKPQFTVRKRVRVSGRVQGVYFRASTQQQARALDLVGWVRNTSDGAVELEAEGPVAAVEALVAWCRRGPPVARVDDVVEEPIEALSSESGFSIRYS